MKRLIDIGFQLAGKWTLTERGLNLHLDKLLEGEQNVLYAFAVNGELNYIGKTTQSLSKRMQGYKNPASNGERGGTTNIKNNRNISTALHSGKVVEIYVLHPQSEQRHGGFLVNLSAGLEDSLIKELSPPWNGRTYVIPRVATTSNTCTACEKNVPARTSDVQSSQKMISSRPGITGRAHLPSAQTLLTYARELRGAVLETLTRKTSFRIEVIGSDLEFTPSTSRAARRERQATLTKVLERFGDINSYQMSDYQDLSFNASYILALVKHWQNSPYGLTNS